MTPLHYASCPLTPTQARYPQIDHGALSHYWVIKRFHLFIYGKEFKVNTDHKPLVALFNNPSSKPSARIERWSYSSIALLWNIALVPQPSRICLETPSWRSKSHNYELESEEHISFCCKKCCTKSSHIVRDRVCYRKGPSASSCHVGSQIWLLAQSSF